MFLSRSAKFSIKQNEAATTEPSNETPINVVRSVRRENEGETIFCNSQQCFVFSFLKRKGRYLTQFY